MEEKFQTTFATLNDVELLVSLHYKCFSKKDHIAMRFGRRFILSTYKWFITSPETFVIVAKQGESLIGFQTVSERPYEVPMLRASWREALIGLIFYPWLVFQPELIKRFIRWLFQQNKDTLANKHVAQLAFIGVDPQVQGRGIGKAIILAAILACRERGISAIITGVMRQNIRSLSMLESAGFIEVPELGTKRLVHLRIDLSQDD